MWRSLPYKYIPTFTQLIHNGVTFTNAKNRSKYSTKTLGIIKESIPERNHANLKNGKYSRSSIAYSEHSAVPTGERHYNCGECGNKLLPIFGIKQDSRIH